MHIGHIGLIVLVILNTLLVYSQSGGANNNHHMHENSVDSDLLASDEAS